MNKNKKYFNKFKTSKQGFMFLLSVFAFGLLLYLINSIGFNGNYNSNASEVKPIYKKIVVPTPSVKKPNKTPDIRPYFKD